MSDFALLKQKILKITGDGWINLQVAKDKAGIKMIVTVADAEKVLRVLTKPRRITEKVPQWVKDRYNAAHLQYMKEECPAVIKDGHYSLPKFPDVRRSGGLQVFIGNYLDWTGGYGNRINTTGRQIKDKQGRTKWITGTTKNGTGDTLGFVQGHGVFFEVKIAADTPSDNQLKQQAKVTRAGGKYYFTHSVEEFFEQYDQFVLSLR